MGFSDLPDFVDFRFKISDYGRKLVIELYDKRNLETLDCEENTYWRNNISEIGQKAILSTEFLESLGLNGVI